MLLHISQLTTSMKALNVADTMNLKFNITDHKIHALQLKVDSLQKIVTKTEIGTGFFSDVISTNLYMFATIIGLAAIISWSSIVRMLENHKRAIKKDVYGKLHDFTEKNESELKDLKESLHDTIYDSARSMYFNVDALKNFSYSFVWAIYTAEALQNSTYLSESTMKTWLNIASNKLKDLTPGDGPLKVSKASLERAFTALKNIEHEANKKILQSIIDKYNHIIYTIESAPENIMEDQ